MKMLLTLRQAQLFGGGRPLLCLHSAPNIASKFKAVQETQQTGRGTQQNRMRDQINRGRDQNNRGRDQINRGRDQKNRITPGRDQKNRVRDQKNRQPLLEARPKTLCLFLKLEPGTFDLSLQRWTCLFEAGPSAQLHS